MKTVAYYVMEYITVVISFMIHAPGILANIRLVRKKISTCKHYSLFFRDKEKSFLFHHLEPMLWNFLHM